MQKVEPFLERLFYREKAVDYLFKSSFTIILNPIINHTDATLEFFNQQYFNQQYFN
jgi:hypothetical protein